MSKLLTKIRALLSSRNLAGKDRQGNRYFTRKEEIDGLWKEKRWVVFKGEEDPTSVPVEWICWLNGQRKQAPTPEELEELEARRERVKHNIALLKKEEEEKRAKEGSRQKDIPTDKSKAEGPDLKSFIQQFPDASEGDKAKKASGAMDDTRKSKGKDTVKPREEPKSSEPTGSGASFTPGTWQPPT